MGSLWVSLWDGCPYGVPMGSLYGVTHWVPLSPPSWGQWLPAQAWAVPMGSLWVSLWGPHGVSLWSHSLGSPLPPSWGQWLPAQGCPRSSRIISFRLRVEPSRGLWDDTAANDAAFFCSDGTTLEGGGGVRGLWGNWSESCPPNVGVCGLRTRVEAPQRTQDDTGLNSAVLLCCD